MFNTRITLFVALAMSLVGQVLATPMPMPVEHTMDTREKLFDVIPAYIRRDIHNPELLFARVPGDQIERRQDVNNIPAEVATMAPNGVLQVYSNPKGKRQNVNNIPAEVATMAPNGVLQVYDNPKAKRQDINNIPAEVATMAPNGVLQVYGNPKGKRQDVNNIPAEVATTAPDGILRKYGN